MLSFLNRGSRAASLVMGLLMGVSLTTACTRAPTGPTSPPKTPNISIVSMSVTAETLGSGGRVYRVVVKLRESGGATATISSIDLTFMAGLAAVASSHADRPISDTANVCPASATVDSRELITTDDNPSHPHATTVLAKVTFTDGATSTSSTTASADVPAPSAPPPAPVFTLAGVVSDDSTGRAIVGATVQVVDGPNAGKVSSTDGNGYYSMPGVVEGSFTVRATANGYNQSDQGVTVSKDTRLDLKLRQIPAGPTPTPAPPSPPGPCAYTISPSSVSILWPGGSSTATITSTVGSCSWRATSNVSWIAITGNASGNGSATLSYIVEANGGVFASNTRFGSITISWAGGSVQLAVQQGGADPELCLFTIGIGGQDSVTVPSTGGQFTATVTWINTGIPPFACSGIASADAPWITFVDPPIGNPMFGPGGGTLTFSVSPNPSPGSPRGGTVSVRTFSRTATLRVTQQ